jgi:hypothetical protein
LNRIAVLILILGNLLSSSKMIRVMKECTLLKAFI